jgi:HD-GYP domain-containing protein (c-di-GMP phosphodiesterase class II)
MHPESAIDSERDHRRGFSLHIYIATVFSVLILGSGMAIGWFNYEQTERLVLSAADTVFDRLQAEIAADLTAGAQVNYTTIDMLAVARINEATSLAERRESLQLFREALRRNDRFSALYIGYADGDMFYVMPVRTDAQRAFYKTPQNAAYLVWSIDHDGPEATDSKYLFYDADLNWISERAVGGERSYDPRTRPWYSAALLATGITVTEAYPFFTSGAIGATVARRGRNGRAVVAGDVTLERLSAILAGYEISPSAEVAIINEKGEVLAYPDAQALVRRRGDGSDIAELQTVAGLGVPVLEHVAGFPPEEGDTPSFEWKGERWKGGLRTLDMPESIPVYLAMAAPEEELVAEAARMRWRSLLLTVALSLAVLPLAWIMSRMISRPLRLLAAEVRSVQTFNFQSPVTTGSVIFEIDRLAAAMDAMKRTVRNFLAMSADLSAERRFARLLSRVNQESLTVAGADAGVLYLLSEQENALVAADMQAIGDTGDGSTECLNHVPLQQLGAESGGLERAVRSGEAQDFSMDAAQLAALGLPVLGESPGTYATAIPLKNPTGQAVGVLCLFFRAGKFGDVASTSPERRAFVEALAGVAATAIDNQRLVKAQKDLLDSIIRLVAGAIDAKSAYTGGHCQRVPVLTRMLAKAACESDADPFRDFQLDEEGWEELDIASWLHDCGKVTTPEYVVDKATKLQTIYDRLHEIRMRFEVLKRDAEIGFWKDLYGGGDDAVLRAALTEQHRVLDEEFAFVAECNLGGECMAPDRVERLRRIGSRTWLRTLDDRLGLSWEERTRKEREPFLSLPVQERLLADKAEHIIRRPENRRITADNPWGFKLDQPEHLYNLGEIYNLSIGRGTLTPEERYVINDHIVQTIMMLSELPFPGHYARVVEYAGGHHEKMDGTGYPRRLSAGDMSLPARMMAIADIFEALTASDRPYKKAKRLSEAVRIMSLMRKDRHIDPDLFALFLSSGVYLDYAQRFLSPEQIDEVDSEAVLAAAG